MAKNTKKRAVIYSNVKANKKLAEERKKSESNQINLDDEVIIGFNSKKNRSGKSDVKKKKVEKVKTPKKNKKSEAPQKTKKEKGIKKEPIKVKPKTKFKIPTSTKVVAFLIMLVAGAYALVKSPVFNIKKINIAIENNTVLTEQEIRDLANISIDENLYSINKGKAIENIKKNPYVENVKIRRGLPNKLNIVVTERTVKFQIKTDDGYFYIDSYGVVLEKGSEARSCMTISGQRTQDIKIGESLNDDDKQGLSDAMKIMQEAQSNDLLKDISRIDISNHYDYLIYFDNLGKMAHVGDTSSLNDKMIRVVKILAVESEYEGEIFVNVDFNKGEYPYFREKV